MLVYLLLGSYSQYNNIMRMKNFYIWPKCSIFLSNRLINLRSSFYSINTPLYYFIYQIYARFNRLPFIKPVTLICFWWIFGTIIPIITYSIFRIPRISLILLFRLIDNSNRNTFLFCFHDFNFEDKNLIEWYNLVKDKLSHIILSNIL